MHNVSTVFLEKVTQNSRVMSGKLYLGNIELTDEDIISMDMEFSLGNDNIPGIGGVVASRIEAKFLKNNLPLVITTQELKPYLGIETSLGIIEYVPMGVFRASPQDVKKTDNTVSMVGYDTLFALESMPYDSKLSFPATWSNIKADLEAKGFKFKSQSLANVTIKEKPNTIRELFSDVAELLGMNVVSNRLGEIEFRKLAATTFETDNYNTFKLLADDDVKLTRLTVEKEGEENEDLTYGNDTGFTIKIKNDSITTQIELATVYNRVFPLSYTAYECDLQGLPHIDVGDVIRLIDRHDEQWDIPIAYHKISYSGGLKSEIRASAPSGAISSTGSTGSNSISQSLRDLRLNVLEVNHVLADKADIDDLKANTASISDLYATKAKVVDLQATNARIENIVTVDLEATNARIGILEGKTANIETLVAEHTTTIELHAENFNAVNADILDLQTGKANVSDLNAVNAKIANLQSNKADIIDLNAANASIDNLSSRVGSIDTLLAGNLTSANFQAGTIKAGDAIIADGAISDAMILNLSVDKILAGDISTTKFRIISDSGNMLMADNTIQIKDNSRVRVQIGKDANNDYNMYVWDAGGNLMFDATGLKASGIKSKIIRDDMVSDTANIDAKKLNINTLFAQMNGSTQTLKSSRIFLDTQAQTLDIAFTSLKSTVTDQGELVTSYGTRISTIEGQISSKVWQTDIDTAKGELGEEITSIDDKYTTLTQAVDGIETSVGHLSTEIDSVSGEVLAVDNRVSTLSQTVDGLKSTVTSVQQNYLTKTDAGITYATNTKVSSLEQTVSGLSSKVTSVETNYLKKDDASTIYATNTKVSELTQTVDSLSSKISSVETNYLTKTDAGQTYTTITKTSSLEQTVNGLNTEISSVKTTVTNQGKAIENHGSSISSLDSAIKLKVDTQTYNTKMTSIDGSISTINTNLGKATSDISVLKGQIALKVEQADIDRTVSEIEIGGRNLVLDSGMEHSFTNDIFNKPLRAEVFHEYIGEKLTISFDAMADENEQMMDVYLRDVTRASVISGARLLPFQVPTEWTRYFYTITLSDISGVTNLSLAYRNTSSAGGTVRGRVTIKNIQIEKGNKATDWTPAPEDIDQAISSVDTKIDTKVSEINISLSSITSRVSSTESSISTVDGKVNSLTTRVSSAEQKITDSAIVSTVRSSTAYTNDLNAKANQSALNATNTRLSTAESTITQHANQIAQRVQKGSIISEINQTAETIKIQASKINLVGAVTVLSDITGNLGTITAGTITGATVRTSAGSNRIELSSNLLRAYADGIRRVVLDHDSLDFYTYANRVGGIITAGETDYPVRGASGGMEINIPTLSMQTGAAGVAYLESWNGSRYSGIEVVSGGSNYYGQIKMQVYDSSSRNTMFEINGGNVFINGNTLPSWRRVDALSATVNITSNDYTNPNVIPLTEPYSGKIYAVEFAIEGSASDTRSSQFAIFRGTPGFSAGGVVAIGHLGAILTVFKIRVPGNNNAIGFYAVSGVNSAGYTLRVRSVYVVKEE